MAVRVFTLYISFRFTGGYYQSCFKDGRGQHFIASRKHVFSRYCSQARKVVVVVQSALVFCFLMRTCVGRPTFCSRMNLGYDVEHPARPIYDLCCRRRSAEAGVEEIPQASLSAILSLNHFTCTTHQLYLCNPKRAGYCRRLPRTVLIYMHACMRLSEPHSRADQHDSSCSPSVLLTRVLFGGGA